ncbi:MAG: hypothetical protein GF329_14130 [Candidatus Lokiarchaeota archaeon]|nr:hypothetical protein [Candidatus Lokiarchaeota archaeon]
MVMEEKRKYYNTIKEYKGQKYTGMRVGGKHSWNYNHGLWNEMKIAPNKWKFEFVCNKARTHEAPPGTGSYIDSKYHWYIIADQKATKLDANNYKTVMTGSKFKIGHKMPNWKKWSYNYKNETYEDKIITILEGIIEKLKEKKKSKELLSYF